MKTTWMLTIISAAGLLAACSDESSPCGWTPEPAQERATEALELACGGSPRVSAAYVPAYSCLECSTAETEGLELAINLVDQMPRGGVRVSYGSIRITLPEQPLSGEMDLTAENVESSSYEVTSGRISWTRTEGMPYVDIPEDELVEGEVYSTSLTFELDLQATGGTNECLVSTLSITQLSDTVELSSEATFCEPFELEDLKDIRVGH